MIFEVLKEDLNKKLVELHLERVKGRPPGCHLSDVVKEIGKAVEGDRYGDGPIDPAVAHAGFLWEDVLSEVLAKQWGWRQREAMLDGIHMTLDGVDVKDRCVLEAKASKISSRNRIDSNRFWLWGVRTKGYCKAIGVRRAKLVILHLNSGYENAGGKFGTTKVAGWLLEWTQREIDENWAMVLRVKKEMEQDGRATW